MKNTCLIITVILSPLLCNAQYISTDSAKVKLVSLDTINIQGHVFDAMGQPASGVVLISKNNKIGYEGYPLYAITNVNGEFSLNGAFPVDTFRIVYKDLKLNVINNKSRYLNITLPQINAEVIGNGVITANRTVLPKPPTQFKVITNATVMDYFGPLGTMSATYNAGPAKFIDYIKSKIIYPQTAINHNIEGVVQVEFTIDRDGTVIDTQILKGIGYGCDEAVINAFKNCHKWRPGINMGKPVTEQFIIEIEFKLTSPSQ
jgi:TonB family protein